ncbi:MAG: hypothetical protein ABIN69_16120 [Aestuariivirga sp.]
MSHYILELAIWLLLAYFVGCACGWILRNIVGQGASGPAMAVAEPAMVAAEPAPTPRVPVHIAAPKPVPVAAVSAAIGKMERPKGITAARSGKADNLQRISGVGPKNEGILNNLGIYHFDQIAAWTVEQVTWVDDHLRFNGRIQREEWIRQAALLAAGKEAEFTKEFGTGGLKNKQGESRSGSHTRKR